MREPIRPWREIVDESRAIIDEIREREGRYLLEVLARCGWRLGDAARELEVQPSGLRALMRARGVLDEYQRHAHPRGAPRKRGVRGGE